MKKKLGRPQAGQKTLSRERIFETGLRIVDKYGIEKLSMRRLAAELGVDPMAIYHHVPGKDALLAGIINLVFSKLKVQTDENADWQDHVLAFAQGYRDLVRSHPQLVLYLISNAKAGTEAVLAANETLYEALASAGLAPDIIVRTANLVVDYLHGFALAEGLGMSDQGEAIGLSNLLSRFAPERFPTMRRVLDSLPQEAECGSFEDGLEIILAGAAAILKLNQHEG